MLPWHQLTRLAENTKQESSGERTRMNYIIFLTAISRPQQQQQQQKNLNPSQSQHKTNVNWKNLMHFAKLVLFGEQLEALRIVLSSAHRLDIHITVRCKILMFLLSSWKCTIVACIGKTMSKCRNETRQKRENCAQKADRKVAECLKYLGIKRLSDDFHRNWDNISTAWEPFHLHVPLSSTMC